MPDFNNYLNEWFYNPTQKNKSNEQLAEELVSKSVLRFPDEQGKTLLHYIANKFFEFRDEFRLALIKVLFNQKADANAIDQHGRTALHDLLETWQDTPSHLLKNLMLSLSYSFNRVRNLPFEITMKKHRWMCF